MTWFTYLLRFKISLIIINNPDIIFSMSNMRVEIIEVIVSVKKG